MAEAYGNAFLETAKDKLVTEITALQTTMATGYDPTFSYTYEKHGVAKLQLNAVSVDLESAEPTIVGTNDYFIRWLITYSVRIHTAYEDGIQDGQKQMRLLNSIAEKLEERKSGLGGGYRIQSVDSLIVRQEFAESDTLGGELQVTISIDVESPQV